MMTPSFNTELHASMRRAFFFTCSAPPSQTASPLVLLALPSPTRRTPRAAAPSGASPASATQAGREGWSCSFPSLPTDTTRTREASWRSAGWQSKMSRSCQSRQRPVWRRGQLRLCACRRHRHDRVDGAVAKRQSAKTAAAAETSAETSPPPRATWWMVVVRRCHKRGAGRW